MPEAKKKIPWTERDITQEDLPAIYEALAEKFPPETIQTGKSTWGADITGVKSQYIANRFNEVLGIQHWRYDILDKEIVIDKNSYVVWMGLKLSIGNLLEDGQFLELASRSYYGGCRNTAAHEALKGAVTNTFKKAASMFGVAKDVYEGTMDEDFKQYLEDQQADTLTAPAPAPAVPFTPEQSTATAPTPTGIDSAALRDPSVQKYLKFFKDKVKDAAGVNTAKQLYERSKEKLTPEQQTIVEKALAATEKKYGGPTEIPV